MKKNKDTQRAMLDVNCEIDNGAIPQGLRPILKETEHRLDFKRRKAL